MSILPIRKHYYRNGRYTFNHRYNLPNAFKTLPVNFRIAYAIWLLFHFTVCYMHNLHDFGKPLGHFANLWVCNLSLLLAAFAILFDSPDYVGFATIGASSGQIFWTLDSIVMFLTNSSSGPFKVADYSSYRPSKFWYQVYMGSHHFWFLPMSIQYLKSTRDFQFTKRHFVGGAVWVMLITVISSLLIPLKCMETVFDNGIKECIFLNINMIQGWWGQNNIELLHIFDRSNGNSAFFYFLHAHFFYSGILNGIWFLLFRMIVNKKRLSYLRSLKGSSFRSR